MTPIAAAMMIPISLSTNSLLPDHAAVAEFEPLHDIETSP